MNNFSQWPRTSNLVLFFPRTAYRFILIPFFFIIKITTNSLGQTEFMLPSGAIEHIGWACCPSLYHHDWSEGNSSL